MIRRVHLRDFKSHEDTLVEFHPGANALLGHNGAGKTSILQAIGLCIFDAGSPGAWVRKGCKSGKATVTFATQDGEYSVERKVGPSGMKLLDAQGNVLAETKADVYTGVRDLLGLPPETDLPRLFEELVGVPQGLLTAAFQQTPEPRRRIFDAILHVHAYRTAFDRLKHAQAHGDQQVQDQREAIARLEGSLQEAPRNAQQVKDADATKREAERTLQAAQTALQAARQELDKIEERAKAAKHSVQKAHDAEKHMLAAQHADEQAAQALEAAQGSAAWLQQHEEELQSLHASQRWLEEHAESIQSAREATRMQAELEAGLPGRVQAVAVAKQRLEKQRAELGPQPEAPDRKAIDEAWVEAKAGLDQAQAHFKALQDRVAEARRTAQELEELEKLTSRPPVTQTHRHALQQNREGQVAIEAQMHSLDAQFQQLEQGRSCPLLEVTCPVAQGDLGQQKESLRAGLQTRLQAMHEALPALQAAADTEDTAAREQARAEALKDRLKELRATAEVGQQALKETPEAKAAQQAAQAQLEEAQIHRDAVLGHEAIVQAWQARAQAVEEAANRLAKDQAELADQQQQLQDLQAQAAQQKQTLDEARAATRAVAAGKEILQQSIVHEAQVKTLERAEQVAKDCKKARAIATEAHEVANKHAQQAWTPEDEAALSRLQTGHDAANRDAASATERIHTAQRDLHAAEARVKADTEAKARLATAQDSKLQNESALRHLRQARGLIKDLGPEVAKRYVEQISIRADEHFRDLHGGRPVRLQWTPDYDVHVTDLDGHVRQFRDLSGGEQVMAALAIRLALLKALSPVPFAIYDEPTINLDDEVRRNVARVLQESGLEQLIVVSHDDAFSESIHNAIRLHKPQNRSLILEDVA